MRGFFLLASVLTFSLGLKPVFANAPIQIMDDVLGGTESLQLSSISSESRDYYSELELLFNSGFYPDPQWLVGWFSGRCYWDESRGDPRNSLFVGWMENADENHGPLFPPGGQVFKGLYGWNANQSANYFDYLTPTLQNYVDRYLFIEKPNAIVSEEQNDALMTGHNTGVRWYIRRNGNYLISQHERDNKVFAYCYTFKRIK
jgi:hypothetical protein